MALSHHRCCLEGSESISHLTPILINMHTCFVYFSSLVTGFPKVIVFFFHYHFFVSIYLYLTENIMSLDSLFLPLHVYLLHVSHLLESSCRQLGAGVNSTHRCLVPTVISKSIKASSSHRL